MSATDFTVDLQDIRFVVHEQLKTSQKMGSLEKFSMFDADMVDAMLTEAERLATEVFAPLNKVGDEAGCQFDGQGNVTTPEGFKNGWNALVEGGWMAAGAPEEYGGMPMPHAVTVAAHEMFTGANVSLSTYPGLARGVGRVLNGFAPDWLKEITVPRLFDGRWAGTMCLTESGAGTSVGDNRTKAEHTDEAGKYLLTGEKIFITAGDQDITDNIIHLVLARAPGAPSGIKGLSIFAVPKFQFDAEGNLGERNGIFVRGIEEKMGLHGSVTTTLELGGNTPCTGWILGQEGDGISIMFHLMNEARIGVGVQGLSGASAAYNLALAYTKERIQGVDIDNIRGVNSGGVLHTLMELNMVRIVGRSEGIGKPMLFGTTREFLVLFGLKGLSDLPKPKELDELLAEGQHKAQARQLALELDELQKQALDEDEGASDEIGQDEIDSESESTVAPEQDTPEQDTPEQDTPEQDVEEDDRP